MKAIRAIAVTVFLSLGSFAGDCPIIHTDPVGQLQVEVIVQPAGGAAPLTLFLKARYHWNGGVGAPLEFYLWTLEHGGITDTISDLSADTYEIEKAGLYEVCHEAGNVERDILAEDCQSVSVVDS